MTAPAGGDRRRVPLRSVVAGALVVTLARPVAWLVGLAGFLAGGGIVVVALPVVALPTPTGIQNLLGGPVSTLIVGTPSPELVRGIALGLAGLAAALAAGLWAGAWCEARLLGILRAAAADEGLADREAERDGAAPATPPVRAVLVVRAASLLPVLAAAAAAAPALQAAGYRELLLPDDLAAPLVLRILAAAPLPVAGILLAWLAADAAAAAGVRRLGPGRGAGAAIVAGWRDLVGRPHRLLWLAALGLAGAVVLVAPPLAAAAVAWGRTRDLLEHGLEVEPIVAGMLAWVTAWLGGLVLAGLAATLRSALGVLETAAPRDGLAVAGGLPAPGGPEAAA